MIDESAQHAGHAGARETDSPSGETHFRVALVSPEFDGLPTIKRHRLVYQVRVWPSVLVNRVPTFLEGLQHPFMRVWHARRCVVAFTTGTRGSIQCAVHCVHTTSYPHPTAQTKI